MDFSLNEMQAMLLDSVQKFIANDYDFSCCSCCSCGSRSHTTSICHNANSSNSC